MRAAGLDLADVLTDRFAPLPHYRFQLLLQKAAEFCNEVKGLGSALLSAIEKKESEHLALLRSKQEVEILQLVESIKKEQIEEAKANLRALRKTRQNTVDRFAFLQRQLGKYDIQLDASAVPTVEQGFITAVKETGAPDDFRSLALIQSEIDQVWRLQEGHIWSVVAGATKASSGVFHTLGAIPINGIWATPVGHGLSAIADGFGLIATNASFWERRASLMAGWQRRRDEWVQQSKMTAEEIRQIGKQIEALEIREQIAQKELENHGKQIDLAKNIDDYLRYLKFTDESLYAWTESQLATLYFSAYQLAFDMARRAERAFRFETGDESATFIRYGQWDRLRKGLLSGERLAQDLRRMETAYLERNRRELEITKHISLLQADPLALLELRETGECEFKVPESLFDLDFPGHYFRRIKSVSLSIPSVVGPYTGVSGTLSLLASRLRIKNVVQNSYGNEENYRSNYLPLQAIATSTGQNDSGMFELNFRDERYLPFEGAGAISRWRFTLPTHFRSFDYKTISDLVLHIRYTAREGGESLRSRAIVSLETWVKEATRSGVAQLFSVRHEFPSEWARFRSTKIDLRADPKVYAPLTLTLKEEHYPYWAKTRLGSVKAVEVYTPGGDMVKIYGPTEDGKAVDDRDERADALSPHASLPGLVSGLLTNVKPHSPIVSDFTLYFSDNSMEDLWLLVQWGKRI
jgi:hypothetical protein